MQPMQRNALQELSTLRLRKLKFRSADPEYIILTVYNIRSIIGTHKWVVRSSYVFMITAIHRGGFNAFCLPLSYLPQQAAASQYWGGCRWANSPRTTGEQTGTPQNFALLAIDRHGQTACSRRALVTSKVTSNSPAPKPWPATVAFALRARVSAHSEQPPRGSALIHDS